MYINYVLDMNVLKPVPVRDGLECIKLTLDNYEQNISDIQYCINLFNSEIVWDEMWALGDAIERFETGDKMYMAKSDGVPIGYMWLKDDLVYNIFMTKKRLHKSDVYTFLKYSLYDARKYTQSAIAYVDDWNIASQTVLERIGFVKY